MQELAMEEVVAAAQLGDTKAFSELTNRFYAMVHGVALGAVGNWSAAEDVAQEVFLLAWANLKNLRIPRAFPIWLRLIARNCAMNYLRDQQYRRNLSEPLRRELHEEPPPACLDPAALAARQECLESIGQELADLSPKIREAIVLFYLEGKSVSESADALGIPVATMKKRLQQGRARLQRKYEQPEAPALDQLLPYAPQPYAQRVLTGMAFGPAAPALGKWTVASRWALCFNHLRHGGSLAALGDAGLLSPALIAAGAVIVLSVIAGSGLVATHTVFQRPSGAPTQAANPGDYYQGTGVINTPHWDDPTRGNYIQVERVLPGYPCDRAGLRPGDRIIKVNGHPVARESWESEDPEYHVVGPAGTKVHVTVLRTQEDGTEKELALDITRDFIPTAARQKALTEFETEKARKEKAK